MRHVVQEIRLINQPFWPQRCGFSTKLHRGRIPDNLSIYQHKLSKVLEVTHTANKTRKSPARREPCVAPLLQLLNCLSPYEIKCNQNKILSANPSLQSYKFTIDALKTDIYIYWSKKCLFLVWVGGGRTGNRPVCLVLQGRVKWQTKVTTVYRDLNEGTKQQKKNSCRVFNNTQCRKLQTNYKEKLLLFLFIVIKHCSSIAHCVR